MRTAVRQKARKVRAVLRRALDSRNEEPGKASEEQSLVTSASFSKVAQ